MEAFTTAITNLLGRNDPELVTLHLIGKRTRDFAGGQYRKVFVRHPLSSTTIEIDGRKVFLDEGLTRPLFDKNGDLAEPQLFSELKHITLSEDVPVLNFHLSAVADGYEQNEQNYAMTKG